jgi:hypothetical protein
MEYSNIRTSVRSRTARSGQLIVMTSVEFLESTNPILRLPAFPVFRTFFCCVLVELHSEMGNLRNARGSLGRGCAARGRNDSTTIHRTAPRPIFSRFPPVSS